MNIRVLYDSDVRTLYEPVGPVSLIEHAVTAVNLYRFRYCLTHESGYTDENDRCIVWWRDETDLEYTYAPDDECREVEAYVEVVKER